MTVPERRKDESELEYLRRKEVCFGIWQADAMEAIADNERVIAELRLMLAGSNSLQVVVNAAFEAISTAKTLLLPFAEILPVPDEKPKRSRKVKA